MKPEVCAPPQDNVLDLTDLDLCDKCQCALMAKFLKMYNETVIDKTWNQQYLDGYKNEE